MDKIFVFTAAYNAEQTVRRTIESVINQSYSNLIYCIVNNGSTDKTGEIINSYSDDPRMVIFHRTKNDSLFWLDFLSPTINDSGAKWFCHIDADDEYESEFIEKMYSFVCNNQLDLAACGYSKVDGITNEVLSTRVLSEHLIIEGNDYTDKFIEYRGFTIYWWAKLVSVPIFLNVLKDFQNPSKTCNDSVFMLDVFYESKRAGIYAESLIKYYQYSNSHLRKTFSEEFEHGQIVLWKATKNYLQKYGNISNINEDFLYAIYFSQLEELFERVRTADISLKDKRETIQRLLNNGITYEMLERDADPLFKNLLKRKHLITNIKKEFHIE